MVMCLGQGADLHMAQLMPLPLTIPCFSKSRLGLPSWFYLNGTRSPGWSWTRSKRAVKRCECVLLTNGFNITSVSSAMIPHVGSCRKASLLGKVSTEQLVIS